MSPVSMEVLNQISAPSGQGPHSPVPRELQRWSWAAFLMNWLWGLGNATPRALWMFVPGVNLAMWAMLGLRGNRWAWQNKTWRSVEEFLRIQRVWAVFGVVLWSLLFAVVLVISGFVFLLGHWLRQSEPVTQAVHYLKQQPQAIAQLGEPLHLGFPLGAMIAQGAQGCALLNLAVSGSRAEGRLYIDAQRDFGQWHFNRLELAMDPHAPRLELLPPSGQPQQQCRAKSDHE